MVALGPGGKLIPYLAKSGKVTPTSIVFSLRSDATCQDGTPLKPTLVANALKRVSSAAFASSSFGAGPFTVAGDDPGGTVTFTTATPNSDMIWAFVNGSSSITCPAGLPPQAPLLPNPLALRPYTLT